MKTNENANLKICLDEVQALKYAIDISNKGDIIVVFYEKLDSLLEFINEEPNKQLDTFDEEYKQYSNTL